ncbi:AGAP008483-PA-like protein [Anopheles sinensis]|uniref:AGAP008483-PA-like protein n=1 Tax=Anopheles sinensis TaxID=74873 RepID=A0A084VL46_ANOSI|nr:AGAP008483-PA-like protein [Anopheles sinensis]
MSKARSIRLWTREETLDLLDILRTSSCISFLDGSRSNRKGEMYRYIEEELRNRNPSSTRDARQIENKWKNLKHGYDKHKQEQEVGLASSKTYEYLTELEDLFLLIANRSLMLHTTNVETIANTETFFDDGLLVEESQEDYSMDEDAVVIEEIVCDSQDAIDFDDTAVASTSAKPIPRRKKLTTENMDALLEKVSNMQKETDEAFIRKQMELIENEFEGFREKEKEHWAQLKLDLEELKEKYLERIQKVARGDAFHDPADETGGNETKRRRTIGGAVGRKK